MVWCFQTPPKESPVNQWREAVSLSSHQSSRSTARAAPKTALELQYCRNEASSGVTSHSVCSWNAQISMGTLTADCHIMCQAAWMNHNAFICVLLCMFTDSRLASLPVDRWEFAQWKGYSQKWQFHIWIRFQINCYTKYELIFLVWCRLRWGNLIWFNEKNEGSENTFYSVCSCIALTPCRYNNSKNDKHLIIDTPCMFFFLH